MSVPELIRDLTQNTRHGGLSCDQAETLETILAACLEQLERGETPHIDSLIAQNPDLAAELRENLAKLAALHRAVVGMTDGGQMLEGLCATNFLEQRTLGDFHLDRPIGRGGMGVVYEAQQISLNRRVALKTLPLAAVLDPRQLARFKNEAQAAASLDHPHIVSVYAVGSDRGVHYYAMRFIDGLSLAEVVQKLRAGNGEQVGAASRATLFEDIDFPQSSPTRFAGPTAADTAPIAALSTLKTTRPSDYFRSVARLGIQAAEALHYAHEMGVVHRDVKPSNMLLDNDGQLYVTDFGLAMTQSSSELTMTGDLLGTLRYMSPEQASGRRALVDRRTDIYSLGASLYELTTLRPAFPEEDRARLLQQIVTDPPQTPSKINRDVPGDLDTIILKSMAKDPAERYETAKAFADDLGRFVKHELIRARRITRFEHVRSWCRRNKAVASLLAAVAALLLVLSIGGPFAALKQSRLASQAQVELNAKTINQLYQDWYTGNVERVSEELKQHFATVDPNEFQFEWELLQRLYDDSRTAIFYENHDHQANYPIFVDFSPRGDIIACGWPGYRVAIYDVQEQSFRPLDNEPAGGSADAVFSPDGTELITVSWSGVINRRDVATSKVIGPVIHCGVDNKSVEWVKANNAIRLSNDGKIVVVAMENEDTSFLIVARLDDGKCIRIPAHDGATGAFALSPDSATLVSSGEDGLIKFWDLNGNQIRQSRPCSYVFDMQFTFDGRKLIICDYVRGLSILDAVTFAELPGLRGPQKYVNKLAMYKDELLATAGIDDRIVLWDMRTGNWLTTLVGHEGNVSEMAFSPDGTSLVSAAEDETLRLWPVDKTFRLANDPAASFEWWRTDLQFSANGRKLTSCARTNASPAGVNVDVSITEWDTVTGKNETIVPQGRHGRSDLAIVPDTEHVVCGGPGEFSLRSRQTGELVRPLDQEPLHEYQHVVVSPDGKWAAGSGHILPRPCQTKYLASRPRGNVGFVFICNLETKWQHLFPIPTDSPGLYIRCIKFSPDSKFLVACGGDSREFSRVDIFSIDGSGFQVYETIKLTEGDAKYEAMKVDFSADSRLFGTVDQAGFARIRSLRNPKQEEILQRKAGLYCLAFSPDGRILALGDSSGIQLCDLQSHFTLAAIPFGRQMRSLEFSPDGRTLAWCSADGKIGFLRTARTTSTNLTPAASDDTD
jgi:serine/threonine protein kinase/WD40 repeat protein